MKTRFELGVDLVVLVVLVKLDVSLGGGVSWTRELGTGKRRDGLADEMIDG